MSTRICGGCRETKPYAEFSKGKCKDGFASYCKACARETWRQWYAKNGDEFRAYVRALRAADPEQTRTRTNALRRKRRVEQPELTRAQDRKKYRRSRAARPEVRQMQKQRHDALKHAAPGRGVSARQWREILTDSLGLCAYCNERRKLTMDHIEPLSRGGAHDPDNVAAACHYCNTSKSDTPLLVWLARRAA